MRAWMLTGVLMVAACGPTIGDQCTTSSECAGQLCINIAETPGGYCSKGCVVNDPGSCPAGSTCHANGQAPNVPACYRTCTQNTDCRTGYTCQTVAGAPNPICLGGV